MLRFGKVYKLQSRRFYNVILLKNFDYADYDEEIINDFIFILLNDATIVSKRIKRYYSDAIFFKIFFKGKIRCLPISERFLAEKDIQFVEVVVQ